MLGAVARFIVFEGGESSGKSTQAQRLARRLDAVQTREPGGTAIGARLRALLLDVRTQGLDDRAEALLPRTEGNVGAPVVVGKMIKLINTKLSAANLLAEIPLTKIGFVFTGHYFDAPAII